MTNDSALDTNGRGLEASWVRPVSWLLAWFLVALGAATAGLITEERRYVIALAILGSCSALIWSYNKHPEFARFVRSLDLRWVLALHSLRAPIGAVFLWLAARGELSPGFANIAGWGDIVSGGLALMLVPFAATRPARFRVALLAFNVIGLVDILLVVGNAQRMILFEGEFASLRVLTGFPGALLPLFVVPLVIATHLLVFARVRRPERG